MAVGAKYHHSCINCGGINTDYRNERGLPCNICLPDENAQDIIKSLEENNSLKDFLFYASFYSQYKNFENFFREKFGKPLIGYQRFWARRLILSKSFTMIAPTGVGKTTFGLIASLWFAKNGNKVALIFPTLSLVNQAEERLRELALRGPKTDVKILAFQSSMKKEEKENFEKDFEEGNFDILVASSQFISKRRNELLNKYFSLVFVDDVDAVLKSSKNIDTLLEMIGIPQEIINETFNNLKKGKTKEIRQNLVGEHGILIVSSATAKPRGLKPLLFRELLGFDIGRLVFSVRNITNIRIDKKDRGKLLEIISTLKDGILLFVNREEEGVELTRFLEEKGIEIGKTWENFKESFERFKNRELGILCGVSSYYGKLVRGIDLPLRIKYVIFWGTPSFQYSVDVEKAPRFILERVLREYFENNQRMKNFIENIFKIQVEKLREVAKNSISNEKWIRILEDSFPNIKISNNTIIFPDVYTYIQASGRTSRILGTNLTKGVSILFEEDNRVFESLRSRLMFLTEEDWLKEEEVNWEALIEEVENSRKESDGHVVKDSKSTLMIVESPTKADTISKFLEKASTRRYGRLLVHESITSDGILLITATKGHVYDLETKNGVHGVEVWNGNFIPVYNSIKRCEKCGYQFTEDYESCPKCASKEIDDKKEILKKLREISLEADEILVATDPDVEGEKISWDVFQYILPVNRNIRRIEMHEITRHGFEDAKRNKRYVLENLVKSQIVRRIEDRWIGFELSAKLQRSFKSINLSAGRVQSTVLGWIVEREKEYIKSEKTFTLLKLENGFSLEVEGEVKDNEAYIKIVDSRDEELASFPPFNTSSILSEASRKFGFGVQETMEILQSLFENGFITYHRTDSTRISSTGQTVAKIYLDKIGKKELFVGRGWGEEGAHEAIRPVKPIDPKELDDFISEKIAQEITNKHLKIYSLIFNRFLVSQMKNPVITKQKVIIKIDHKEIEADIPVFIKEEGWLSFNPLTLYPPFEEAIYRIIDKKTYKKHAIPLFTQATIIEEMKKKEIGRPSTYAKIIEILFRRGYIVEDSYKRLRATPLGKKVYNFLKQRYKDYIVEETTRELEHLMEIVENGEKDHQEVLRSIYQEFQGLMNN
ncbi:MAG: reverse gyrase [Dictyoglomaceae bacterium]